MTKRQYVTLVVLAVPVIVVIMLILAHTVLDQILLRKLAAQREGIRAAGGAVSFLDFDFPELADQENAAIAYRYARSRIWYPEDPLYQENDLRGQYQYSVMCVCARPERKGRAAQLYEPLTDDELKLIEAYISRNTEFFEILRKARQLSGCQFGNYDSPMAVAADPGALFPELAYVRVLARHMATRAVWDYRHGNIEQAYEWTGAILHLSNDLRNDPLLIVGLVRIAIASIGLNTLQTLLCEDRLPENLPGGVMEELGLLVDRDTYALYFEGERCFSNGKYAQQTMMSGRLLRPFISTPNQIQINTMFSKLLPAIREDDFSKRSALLAPLKAIEPPEPKKAMLRPHRALMEILAPALLRATEAFDRLDAQANGARLAIALKQYHREHGEYPDTLSSLVPMYLKALPQDPFTGDDFVYHREEEGFVVYSLGSDQVDDGGMPWRQRTGDIIWCGLDSS